ncbi:hypothetical protein EH228_04640 [Erwinia endophytica]|uniref:hypothetical protein n=1 Tax=Erwinia endophytica TaxID=1563158 RepID=UPI001265F628|nr:hypothetical protein [Erwinia endophytica]KAB8312968.1 hypothetical protein EH228_04640 [Erwinia endophytica]
MKLTIKDNEEIDGIISNLTEGDREIIQLELERLTKQRNPFLAAIRNHDPDEFTQEACDWLEDDVDYQNKIDGMFWEALVYRLTREYAINIWRDKHSYWEVA